MAVTPLEYAVEMMRRSLLSLIPLALLSACAPRQTVQVIPTVTAQTSFNSVSFYPAETGLQWSYVPENEPNTEPYVVQNLGPTLFGATQVQSSQMTGRGALQVWYRQTSDAGQRLLGFRKPGVSVSLEPAWQEYPANTAWRVGATWSGSSKATLRSDDGKVTQSGTLNYLYKVLEQRQVTVGNQLYTVWVVNRQMTDDLGGLFPASQTIWFMPYIGEVRTAEGLLLTGRNFTPGTAAGRK